MHSLGSVNSFLSDKLMKRCEVVGGEHMVFFGVPMRFNPGSGFPTGSVVVTEKDSSCSSG